MTKKKITIDSGLRVNANDGAKLIASIDSRLWDIDQTDVIQRMINIHKLISIRCLFK